MDGRAAIRAMVRVATTPFGEPSVVLLRRSAMDDVGPFSDRYGTLIDCEYYSRLLTRGDVVSVDATLGAFLARPASWSARSHRMQAAQCRSLFRELARQPELDIRRRLLWPAMARTVINSAGRRVAFFLATTGAMARLTEKRRR
jgi:hypothetical protein